MRHGTNIQYRESKGKDLHCFWRNHFGYRQSAQAVGLVKKTTHRKWTSQSK